MQSCVKFESRFVPAEIKAAATSLHEEAVSHLGSIRERRCAGAEWTGWFDYPSKSGGDVLAQVEKFVRSNGTFFDLVVVIGIGGSYAGARAVSEALSHTFAHAMPRSAKVPVVFAGHHLSEGAMMDLIDLCDRRQPLINVVSKSGTTTEPGVAFRILRNYMEKRFGERESGRRMVVTTDASKGALRSLARERGYQAFVIPDDVGGRFSVLTPVGILPMALAGFDVRALMEGADRVFSGLRSGAPVREGLAAIEYACLRKAAWDHGKRIEVMNVSDPRLAALMEWWKQLFGESEGKAGMGIFPASFLSTTDLHSLGQFIQDGTRNLFETFITFEQPAAAGAVERRIAIPGQTGNADELGYLEGRHVEELNVAVTRASQLAHSDGGVPVAEIACDRLDEFHLGALFAFFEVACGVSALMMGVNPFDQPGVESYKRNLFALLGKPGFESEGAALARRLKS
ncbi:MAG: glucose-6-phosphate isomerase [Pseudomonadota bacterium]